MTAQYRAEQQALQQVRKQFPILDQQANNSPLVYLDNAATTQKPQRVIDSLNRYYTMTNSNVHRASHTLSAEATLQFEQARETLAQFINAGHSKEVIWTRGTTESINLIAHSWGSTLRPGDEIILSTLEHHANIVPWQLLAQRTGAVINVIPLQDNSDLDLAAYKRLLSTKTRLVAVTHVSNAIGTINPVKQIIALAHAAGALALIDGAQALPHFNVDVTDLDADFYVFSAHKLYAPTGIGVLYAKQALLESMPPWQAGGEMIAKVSFTETTFNDLPFKFEAGTPNISGAIGFATAIKWLQAQDRRLLEQHEAHLFNLALDGCSQIKGWQRIGSPEKSVSLLSFTLAGQHQQDIGYILDQQGIAVRTGHHCAMPLMQALSLAGTTRASFAFYNTRGEVNRLVEALDRISHAQQVSIPTHQPQTDDDRSQLSAQTSLHDKLLALNGWNARYREIMLQGKQLAHLPETLKSDAHLVKGCESNTWLVYECQQGETIRLRADSDARIIRGLLALILDLFDNKTAQEIQATDIESIFNQLALQRHLSPSRGNGIRAIVDKIYQIAEDSLTS
jgi:cysteine sulfinate desulfinase/cysteine desulfurase/selenocysteine lyase